jgi:hypothetical protein
VAGSGRGGRGGEGGGRDEDGKAPVSTEVRHPEAAKSASD